MIREVTERELLARIRTLLALERNHLAEERTIFSKFRTGLTLALIGPPASTAYVLVFNFFQSERIVLLDIIMFSFFAGISLLGLWISLRSRRELNLVRKKRDFLRQRIAEIAKRSKNMGDWAEFP